MERLRRWLRLPLPDAPSDESPALHKSRTVRQELRAGSRLIERRTERHVAAVCKVKEDVEQGRRPDAAAVLRESGSLLADRMARRQAEGGGS